MRILLAPLVALYAALIAIGACVAQDLGAAHRENIDAWYSWILVWLMRPGVGAILAGALAAFVIPQRVKMDFPADWPADRRRRQTRRWSFWCGFWPTLVFWPVGWDLESLTKLELYGVLMLGGFAALMVGSLAPWTYSVVMNQLYRRGWVNELKWSGEARAQAKRSGEITDTPEIL